MFDAINFKNKSLDILITKNIIPQEDDIHNILDNIFFAVHYYKCSIDILDELFSLFRKWKTLANIYYPGCYEKSLDKSSAFYCELNQYDFNEANKLLLKRSNDYISPKEFGALTRIVNPYFDLPLNKIAKLDKDFFLKYSTLGTLNNAVAEFKKSNIEQALKLNVEALMGLRQFNELDDLNLYFCAWSLHNIGNIELVKGNYKKASYFFFDSLKLKEQIEQIPRVHIYATKLKFLTCKMHEKPVFEYISELKSFHFEVESNRETLKENMSWVQNILIDSSYNLAKSYFYINDKASANRFLNISIEKGKEYNDNIGLVRGYILKMFMSDYPGKMIKKLTELINSLTTQNRKSPYLGLLLSDENKAEWELINTHTSKLIISAFDKNGIIREKLPLNDYKTKMLTDEIKQNF